MLVFRDLRLLAELANLQPKYAGKIRYYRIPADAGNAYHSTGFSFRNLW
jgi:hypothetical protein